MRCEGILLSNTVDFDDLLGVSDMFVPACGAWVGDYPYLDKVQFKAFLAERVKKERIRRFGSTRPPLKPLDLLPEPRRLGIRKQVGVAKEYALANEET